MRGKLLDILAWAAASGVKEFDVTDDDGTTWTVQFGERQPVPTPPYPTWRPGTTVDGQEAGDE